MQKRLVAALFATAMIPAVAVAQTSTPPAGGTTTTEPAAPATDAPAGGAMTAPAGGAMDAPAAGATDAEPADEADAPAGGMAADMASAADGPFVVVPPTGAWRVTDLNGKSVEDATGENIGSISDVLVDENGEVIAVLVGVGGFLGIGAKDVAVSMDALEFGPGNMEGLASAPAADAAPAGGMAAGTPAAPATDTAAAPEAPEAPVVGEDNLPDRIVLAVTREELEAAPAYGEPDSGEATDGAMAPAGGGMAPASGGMAPAGGTAPAPQ